MYFSSFLIKSLCLKLYFFRAVKDCSYVIHTASPFPSTPPSNPDDVLLPAVDGTKNVLQACADAGTIKRVVITSSVAAIHG